MGFRDDMIAMIQAEAANISNVTIWPITIDEGVSLPAIAYQKISDPERLAHDGATGFVQARYQFSFLGSTFLESEQIREQFRTVFNGKRKVQGGTEFHLIERVSGREIEGTPEEVKYTQDDYIFHYRPGA